MPTINNKPFFKVGIILSLIVLAMSSCSETADQDPKTLPAQTQTTEASPTVTVDLFEKYAVVGLAQGSVLNVHEKPSTESPILNQIPSYGTDILPTGEVHREGDATWLFISLHEISGWVKMEFLAEQHGTLPQEIIKQGQQVIESLRAGQYNPLIPLIHPESCLRFSPYQYLNSDNLIICPPELDTYNSAKEPLTWGHFDGTGKPIHLTFNEYHQQFVYDQDYQKPSIVGFNTEVSSGNSINNIQEIYPDGIMIEYYFPGIDPRYAGMDWRSLRLVFLQENDQWYLTAIIHGEWTI